MLDCPEFEGVWAALVSENGMGAGEKGSSKAVVLVSGGMDSAMLLHHVVNDQKRAPAFVLSYNYGQCHSEELECARRQAKLVAVAFLECVKHRTPPWPISRQLPQYDRLSAHQYPVSGRAQ